MERPGSVTAFGILNIVFAVFGFLGLFGTIALFSMAGTLNIPVVKLMRECPTYGMWLKLTIPLGLLSCGVLLAAGIGLLRLENWGRKLSIGYAIYAIIFSILGLVMNFIFLFGPLLEEASKKQGPEAAAAIYGVVGGSIGGCFGLIYPILLLVFMTRPKVVAAFHPATPPALPTA
jgi:hypothetical protein